MVSYRSLSFPKEMIEIIEKVIKENPGMGYVTVPEFLKDAAREKLIKLGFFEKKS